MAAARTANVPHQDVLDAFDAAVAAGAAAAAQVQADQAAAAAALATSDRPATTRSAAACGKRRRDSLVRDKSQ